MESIFFLIVLFFTNGDDSQSVIRVKAFDTAEACEMAIKPVTAELLKASINQASVSCKEYIPDWNDLGDLS